MFYVKKTPITNTRLSVASVQCSAPLSNELMICTFKDEFGNENEFNNVTFVHYDVQNPLFDSHRDIELGELVISADFGDNPTICEVMGTNEKGLTVKCWDS